MTKTGKSSACERHLCFHTIYTEDFNYHEFKHCAENICWKHFLFIRPWSYL